MPPIEAPHSDESQSANDLEVFSEVVAALKRVDPDSRIRLFHTLATFFEIHVFGGPRLNPLADSKVKSTAPSPRFSEDRSASPKQFLFEKKPLTDTEKVACLAYYLTHYRSTAYFKTLDISKLNTEGAQVKFSNPANAVDNATKAGLLAQATKGQKQLSAAGEVYVQALPDRTAAREAVAHARRKKSRGRTKSSTQRISDAVPDET